MAKETITLEISKGLLNYLQERAAPEGGSFDSIVEQALVQYSERGKVIDIGWALHPRLQELAEASNLARKEDVVTDDTLMRIRDFLIRKRRLLSEQLREWDELTDELSTKGHALSFDFDTEYGKLPKSE